ncbi:MAG TPA: hypothetical protein VNX21_09445 [Candidatus Thermoplasmatota archaeon]|nr:hypothetical protein [Candidatus Thermoplasmatota archaeon]
MKAGLLVALLVALAGCTGPEGGSPNPNLLAPKVVVGARPDGNATLFVHGAFREHLYEWILVRVDNATLSNRTWTFSSEERVDRAGFFLEVEVGTADSLYRSRARVDLNATDERVRVAFLDDDGWNDARAYNLPFEHVADRPRGGRA